MLNSDQKAALAKIKSWWFSNHRDLILTGPGGCGKTYLIDYVLKEIKTRALILAPTHEALKQIMDKVEGEHEFKTCHSALGITPTDIAGKITFEQKKMPAIWDSYELCIVDEVSMLERYIIDLIRSTGIKVLWCGHAAQLPPVSTDRKIFDKCISPIFKLGIPEVELRQPMRNTGHLWDFCNKLEADIYSNETQKITWEFDINKNELKNYVETHKEDIFSGNTKFILWTNRGVGKYNRHFRRKYFGEIARTKHYLPGDKIILTKPFYEIPHLECLKETTILDRQNSKPEFFFTNTKAEVITCEEKLVKLNKTLHIPVHKILARVEGDDVWLYEPVFPDDHHRIAQYYEHRAWELKTPKAKDKAYKERAFIRSCFGEILHSYAISAHRSQGSSIPSVIIILSDIMRNSCEIERKKMIYVAASRSMTNLMIYRGI